MDKLEEDWRIVIFENLLAEQFFKVSLLFITFDITQVIFSPALSFILGSFIDNIDNISELKQRRFWATYVNRKWGFCILGQWFANIFR